MPQSGRKRQAAADAEAARNSAAIHPLASGIEERPWHSQAIGGAIAAANRNAIDIADRGRRRLGSRERGGQRSYGANRSDRSRLAPLMTSYR